MGRWDHTRQLLRIGRPAETGGDAPVEPFDDWSRGPDRGPRSMRCRSICIASGKGGTGKSSITASLADLFRHKGRALLLDADLGCANAHIFHDVHPDHSFADVIAGDREVHEIVTACAPDLDLLPGGSGVGRLAGLQEYELEMIGRGLTRVEPLYAYLLVDSAAGLSRQTVAFAAACDQTLLVTTPDVTAMTDAYAFLKVFTRQCEALGERRALPLLVVNRAANADEASQVGARLQEVTRKFLDRRLEVLGWLPEDRAVFRSTQQRQSVVAGEPDSPVAQALELVATKLEERLQGEDGAGMGARLEAMSTRERTPRRA
ncbi:MAG: P-loop NTPase [Planctomycetota bacterium]|nr:P-loop NTPase [Planctomycetota bacterium]